MLTCTGDAHRLLREAAELRGVSRETIDELAGFTPGYAGKLLCEPPTKGFSLESLFAAAGALGKGIALVDDPKALARLQKAPRKVYTVALRKQWRNAKAQAAAREILSGIARKGAKARWDALTPAQRREHMSRMGRASGKARKRRPGELAR